MHRLFDVMVGAGAGECCRQVRDKMVRRQGRQV